MNPLAHSVEPYVKEIQGVRTLPLERLDAFTQELGLSRREAEIAALEQGIMPRRYLCNHGPVRIDGQLVFLRSCAAVIARLAYDDRRLAGARDGQGSAGQR